MKTNSLLKFTGILMAVAVALSSCNSSIQIAKKRHSKGFFVSIGSDNHSYESKARPVAVSEQNTTETVAQEEVATANSETTKELQSKVATVAATGATSETKTSAPVKSSAKKKTSKLKKALQVKKAIKEHKAANDADVATLLLVILAIILPPVAVFLVRGIDIHFWLSIILTLLFWLPGIIHALLVIFGAI